MVELILPNPDDSFYRTIGILGFLFYVSIYTCLSLRILSSESIRYFVCNTCAAMLVLISLTHEFNLASALIQVFWIALGVVGITIRVIHRYQSALLSIR